MIITINGDIGSGKSTVGKLLAKKLNVPYYSTGNILREIATNRDMTILELMSAAKTDPSIDYDIDEYQKNLPSTVESFVIEGRLGWHFIPQATKLYLTVDIKEAARRIFEGQKKHERDSEIEYQTIDEVVAMIKDRATCDLDRFQTLYGVNPMDHSNYDHVIDTTNDLPDVIVANILDKLGQ